MARPIMRPGEVLEAVPGFITSQHSGEGKANQYYLRGFNLDHGSDFATTVAGVPMNESSGAHAHGYSDVNLLIPELVSGVQYTKGPYFAEHGDFSAAGSANISYVNVLERAPAERQQRRPGDGGACSVRSSPEVGAGTVLMALETEYERRALGTARRHAQGERRRALQPGRRAERVLHHGHGVRG